MIARRLAETWVSDAITVALRGRLDHDEAMKLLHSIAGSAVIQEMLETGAWAQAITDAYNQAREAMSGCEILTFACLFTCLGLSN